ncbi:MAG: LysE family transporter [Nitrosopumilaceae archaeon]|nr:LysE family transporter [Nitrosopumilaceae archaeon]
MQEVLFFAASVILISASGVLSPGPLFASTIVYGLKEKAEAGIKIAHGHTIVELPLVILLGVGVISFDTFPEFRSIISFIGAFALFAFAGLQIKGIIKNNSLNIKPKYGPILSGVIFSALNPFFLIWWFTVGFKLISDALEIWSIAGIFIMFGLHIWMDYLWLGAIAFFSSKSTRILSNQKYKILMLIISGLLVYFGITFLVDGLTTV